MTKTLRILLGCFLTAWLMLACKPSTPREFISSGEMVDVLYDYHLADAMAQTASGDYATNLIAYREAVFKKYGITQEKFDTSMVYYMRHTDELHAIYEKVADRMSNEAHDLGSDVTVGVTISANGDTTDVWKQERSMVLIPNEPFNVVSYSIKADTTFHKGDNFILAFHNDFIFQDGMRDGIAIIALVFNNDSIASRSMHVASSGNNSLSISDNDSLGVKEVRGFFMLTNNAMGTTGSTTTTLRVMSISNIHLLRCHPQPAPKPMQQAIPTNPAAPDSQRLQPAVERR